MVDNILGESNVAVRSQKPTRIVSLGDDNFERVGRTNSQEGRIELSVIEHMALIVDAIERLAFGFLDSDGVGEANRKLDTFELERKW